jgi:hypothetical protein
MTWRDLEGKRIEEVRPVDESEVVLQLEGGELAKIQAKHPPNLPTSEAELELQLQKARQ